MNEISIAPLVPAATSGNLTNLIAERAWFEPNRTMMSRPLGDVWQKVSAQELEAEIRATAKGLVAAGIQIGDRVGIMARTRYEWTILDFAIWFAGACVVPIYETSSAEQVDWILSDSGAVGLIVETPTHREFVNPVLPSHTKHVWTMTEDVLSVLANAGAHIGDDEIDRRRNALLPDTLATLIYTSGTTGKPKGVQLTHGNFLSECGNVVEGASDLFLKPNGSTLLFLPVAHVLVAWSKLELFALDCTWHIAAIPWDVYNQILLLLNQPSSLLFQEFLKRFTTAQRQRPKPQVRERFSAKLLKLLLLIANPWISAALIHCFHSSMPCSTSWFFLRFA
jgi:long-chain acyl-CoA synthetase